MYQDTRYTRFILFKYQIFDTQYIKINIMSVVRGILLIVNVYDKQTVQLVLIIMLTCLRVIF